MVKKNQTIEEYYDEDDDELSFIPPNYFESDEKLVLIACLLLLEQRYRLLESMTPSEVMDEIDEIMDSLEDELRKTAKTKVDDAVFNSLREELIDYSIPIFGYVEVDESMYPIMDSSITSLVNQLRDDLKTKSMFFDENMSNSDFDITPNFRRAIQRVVDGVGNNMVYSKEKTHRNVMKFVYGEDKLWRWLSAHLSTTCEWCLLQEKEAPRRIDEWELDHPHGHCVLDVVDPTYSPEYYSLLIE